MNYLAHLYLSHQSRDEIVGSILGDFVKGDQYLAYPDDVQKAVILHRRIDSFTDRHPIFHQSKNRIKGEHRRYAGIMLDLFYDHFLARKWLEHHEISLGHFAENVYQILQSRNSTLPDRLRTVVHYMSKEDWLSSYQEVRNINRALNGISKRLRRENPLPECIANLENNYDVLEQDFDSFFPALCEFVQQQRAELGLVKPQEL